MNTTLKAPHHQIQDKTVQCYSRQRHKTGASIYTVNLVHSRATLILTLMQRSVYLLHERARPHNSPYANFAWLHTYSPHVSCCDVCSDEVCARYCIILDDSARVLRRSLFSSSYFLESSALYVVPDAQQRHESLQIKRTKCIKFFVTLSVQK